MRFCFIFCPFLGELPCILGRLPFVFGDNILYKCTYLSIFATVKITLQYNRQDLRGVHTKVHTNFKLLI